MSTIKTTNLQHPSAASPNLTLAADGSVSGGAGLGGLVHIHTETFSGQSSVSLDNVFSSEYENYRILSDYTCSGNGNTQWRFRVSGVDNTSGVYQMRNLDIGSATNASTSDQTIATLVPGYTAGNSLSMDVISPFSSKYTHVPYFGHGALVTIIALTRFGVVSHLGLTSFDGFTISRSAGTFTGTIRVYGYANS